jgi:hypothetical protein
MKKSGKKIGRLGPNEVACSFIVAQSLHLFRCPRSPFKEYTGSMPREIRKYPGDMQE